MIMRLHRQQITNWFESRRSVSQQRGANRKGEEHTSKQVLEGDPFTEGQFQHLSLVNVKMYKSDLFE